MKKFKLPLLVAAIGLALAGLASLLSPPFRYANFGTVWNYRPQKDVERKLLLTMEVGEGREVRGDEDATPVGIADSGKLEALIVESCKAIGGETVFEYKVDQVRSEQLDWNQPEGSKLANLRWTVRMLARGPVADVSVNDKNRTSLWSRPNLSAGWVMALWPGLPSGRVRLGESWSSQVRTTCVLPEMPDGIPMTYQLRYTWGLATREGLFDYTWTGTVSGENTTGNLSGHGMYHPEDGWMAGAEFQMELQSRVPTELAGGQKMYVALSQKQRGRIVRQLVKE